MSALTNLECGCCYKEIEFKYDAVVQCTEGHLFCVSCLRHYAEEQLFGYRTTQLKCMHQGSFDDNFPCVGKFRYDELARALPAKILELWDEATAQEVLHEAGLLRDIVCCPKCGYRAILPEEEKVFVCPVSGCDFESCRLCGSKPHLPLTCSEVEHDLEQTNHRTKMEEAMTAARLRVCEDCGKHYFKTSGCNRVQCACGALLCYVCGNKIDGYGHFCQQAHCNHECCGKCLLYSDSVEDDSRAVEKAGLKFIYQGLSDDGALEAYMAEFA